MGISGLLPALKSIQVTKHLEEYAGKTIAVDAYVWLHKGAYACATELATGKNTNKYVNYAMHRVKLLKHHRIQPYIVFDGGPLPAKKGTEKERKQKRVENLSRGNALAAQGKHSLARECYIKCVDVTPQMAFQFIKALRAENIPYVVAPYEADAQLAYLERTGVADAILTEDSDLLVFGCKNVLYKLDMDAHTVVSISREHFGSVAASASDTSSISLYGWSDAQFRAMAILSGCDYLPSIQGIGLKTANNLLKKWKTPAQVVKAIALEGKKSVPSGYWKEFQRAEKCFLHQRVYCPEKERLVHLSDVGSDWNEEFDAYVGSDMDPILAKSIAVGDSCPVSRLPMSDINPSYMPQRPKQLPLSVSPHKSNKAKGKMRESAPTGGILSFFGPNPIIPPRKKASVHSTAIPSHKPTLAGKASGKRTLAEVMDQDIERKKRHRKSPSPIKSNNHKQSKFFFGHSESRSSVQRRHSEGGIGLSRSTPGPSRSIHDQGNKENEGFVDDVGDESSAAETSEPELDGTELSMMAHVDVMDIKMGMDLDVDDFPDLVEQEDGYISPSPSYSRDEQDLSSPMRPGEMRRVGSSRVERGGGDDDDDEMNPSGMLLSEHGDEDDERDFGNADVLSSPVSVKKPKALAGGRLREFAFETPRKWTVDGGSGGGGVAATAPSGRILVEPTPTPTKGRSQDTEDVPSPTLYRGPDLRSMLGVDAATDLDFLEGQGGQGSGLASGSASPPSPSPETPDSLSMSRAEAVIDVDAFDDDAFALCDLEEQRRLLEAASRTKVVMDGWRQKWALPSNSTSNAGKGKDSSKKHLKNSKTSRTGPMATKTKLKGSATRKSLTKTFNAPSLGPLRAADLRRSETNVTPGGRYSLAAFYKPPKSAPSKMGGPSSTTALAADTASSNVRKSLIFEVGT